MKRVVDIIFPKNICNVITPSDEYIEFYLEEEMIYNLDFYLFEDIVLSTGKFNKLSVFINALTILGEI